MDEQPLVPVAQYLRMSTSHQRYSLENQRAALALYAREHGMTIVQTYSDPGCSGLELKHRPGLRQLLLDVVSKPFFHAIIVYDVSRWGRFQDPDEAAHYEFVCKSVGVPVHYSSELFVNDGSVANVLLKQLKRTMAGEYSRELGVKVYAGQKRLVQMGHRPATQPPWAPKFRWQTMDSPQRHRDSDKSRVRGRQRLGTHNGTPP